MIPIGRRSLLLSGAAAVAASAQVPVPRVACLSPRPVPGFGGFVSSVADAASGAAAVWLPDPARFDPQTYLPAADVIDRAIAAAAASGARLLIVGGQGLYRDGRVMPNDMIRKVLALNNAGRRCMARRIQLCYRHSHAEFIQNGLEIEHMMRRTNPELVSLCLDPAAAVKPGAFDTAGFLERYTGRIEALYLTAVDNSLAPLAAAIRTRRWDGLIIAANAAFRPAIRKTFGA